ncbi:ABC-type transport system, involved in lipoprotein release, permease component [Maribacter aquivivus]|uniref:ABC-type transport system, involved in lipoprotein release, permease component n=1 Tax=Maribacter aquivivus TaxID=228958 RepID=A0A1M6JDC0_9FLAO|nr:ABC transporter permease [Maribacter aquivivus]SHJ44711.1 ABC-type transport system, involved in lipoprotein release, permease component [Maribacter aquivivus]
MFKNYLKIAWRNLIRNKGFSILNIAGLSIGLTVFTLIILWINFELGFDRFHENQERIYEVNNQYDVEGEIWTWNSTPKAMAPAIKKDYPEVERISRYFYDTPFLFSVDDKRIKATGTIVDPDFLSIFSFPLVQGDIASVFSDVNSVVITETFAKKMFGDKDPIGEIVVIDNADTFKVTGILKDLPTNTDFTFEFLVPWAYLTQIGWDDTHWGNNSVATYVMLKKDVNFSDFSTKIKTLRENYDEDSSDMVTLLYPYSRTYLYNEFENGKEVGGRIDLIKMFGIIAAIILIIACINFMNLSTARSEKRAKEVGVRKVMGAPKKHLIYQFLGESILISAIAAIFSILLVLLVLPAFNDLVGHELELDFTSMWFWISALAIVLFTGLLAGSYPALYLSAFKPSAVLKGTFHKADTLITPRKVLVVVQFSVAIILITSTLIISQQLDKVQNRQLGYSKDNLIYTFLEGDIDKNYELIKKELLKSGAASSITKTSSPITESWSNTWGFEWSGKKENDKTIVLRLIADDVVAETMGLELLSGRDLNLQEFPTDSTAVLLNESAVSLMGFNEPLGQIIKDNGIEWHVVGVVKDFVFNSPFQKIEPLVIEGAKGWFNVMHMKLNEANSTSENLAIVENIYKKYNPEYPFDFEFVDGEYAEKFSDQQRTGKLATLFTLLTILISCLGLFGLASYMAENRIKEVGIRKVLGASVTTIVTLLSKDFLKLVAISILIAIPIACYYMSNWLEEFDFRISISVWVFAIAGGLTLVIALVTVSFQAIKAARANPVKSLRSE